MFLHFAINAGYLSHVFSLFPTWFKEAHRIPWAEFVDALTKSGFKPGKEFLTQLLNGSAECGFIEEVIWVSRWNDQDTRFAKLHEQISAEHRKRHNALREKIFEKLEFAREHRMLDEENRLLLLMDRNFPDDPRLKSERKGFKERWARNIISKNAHKKLDHELRMKKPAALNENEREFADIIFLAASEVAEEFNEKAYDLAIGFYFMELYPEALALIQLAPEGAGSDWFYLELLLHCRHFVECLDVVNQVELKYADDPESTFAATYIRAQALWGLGQTGAAIELLRSIVDLRPHYRSAHALLNEWGGSHA